MYMYNVMYNVCMNLPPSNFMNIRSSARSACQLYTQDEICFHEITIKLKIIDLLL